MGHTSTYANSIALDFLIGLTLLESCWFNVHKSKLSWWFQAYEVMVDLWGILSTLEISTMWVLFVLNCLQKRRDRKNSWINKRMHLVHLRWFIVSSKFWLEKSRCISFTKKRAARFNKSFYLKPLATSAHTSKKNYFKKFLTIQHPTLLLITT